MPRFTGPCFRDPLSGTGSGDPVHETGFTRPVSRDQTESFNDLVFLTLAPSLSVAARPVFLRGGALLSGRRIIPRSAETSTHRSDSSVASSPTCPSQCGRGCSDDAGAWREARLPLAQHRARRGDQRAEGCVCMNVCRECVSTSHTPYLGSRSDSVL